MDAIREQWLGKYIMSLSPTERIFGGRRIKVIATFIESGAEISKPGYLGYLRTEGLNLSDTDRKYIIDFLYFTGVRWLGGRKKPKGRVVERIEAVTEANKKKVSAFIEWLKTQYDYSENTIKVKRDNMVKFFSYFNDFNLVNCRDFITTQQHEGKNPKTLNVYMITLRHYGEYIKKPVTLKQIAVSRSLSVENVPTEKEYLQLLQWLRGNEKWQMYWIVKILGTTGMRQSELYQLTWKDILSGEFFPLCKGKKRRMIYFPKTVIKELKEWLKNNPMDVDRQLVVSKRFDKPLSKRGLDQTLKLYAVKAEFPKEKAHCHAFRHFFAKQFLAKTKDVIQLAELLGHESVDTTRLYLQKSKAEQAREINRYITW